MPDMNVFMLQIAPVADRALAAEVAEAVGLAVLLGWL